MSSISVVIAAYNAAEHIDRCLDSICSQSFGDLEIIVVDDGSTDATAQKVQERAVQDTRIVLVSHECNKGILAAHCTGVRKSTADYVLLVDSDDELVERTCEYLYAEMMSSPVDILHFGVEVVGETQLAQKAVEGMMTFINPPAPRLLIADEILEYAFQGMPEGYDWNATHKLVRGDLYRSAVSRLEDVRLDNAEDIYIMFAVEAAARSYRSIPNSHWYLYHVGQGGTLSKMLNLDEYSKTCREDARSYELVKQYAKDNLAADGALPEIIEHALRGVGTVLAEHCMNELLDHLDPTFWQQALQVMEDVWAPEFVLRELYRVKRDRLHALTHTKSDNPYAIPTKNREHATALLERILVLEELVERETPQLAKMKKVAKREAERLETRTHSLATWKNQPIKIFVSSHKDAEMFDSNILQPIQVGSSSSTRRFSWSLHDDEGENISDLNSSYCELTAQYWAWKNVDAEYYGFCHYRRHFVFNDAKRFEENPFGEIDVASVNQHVAELYGINDESIRACLEDCDIVTSGAHDVSAFPEKCSTVREQYEIAPHLNVRDLDLMTQIVKELQPDYAQDIDAFLNGKRTSFCNMFIMRKDIFNEYCAWLFPLLDVFYDLWDHEKLGVQSLRTPGHLSERLLNVFIMHHQRVKTGWKVKRLQSVHIEDTDHHTPIEPLEPRVTDKGPVVPIVLAANDNYAPMLATTIESIAENLQARQSIDAIVLHQDISAENQRVIKEHFKHSSGHVRVRFLYVGHLIKEYSLETNNKHISLETYLRFLIPDLLPFYDKAIYLDCDLVVESDVTELFNTNLEGKALAAVRDIDYLGNLNMDDGVRMQYSVHKLKMSEPYSYFQAGVLVLNLALLREKHSLEEWLNMANHSEYIYDDQDILNVECEGQVVYLDPAWNVTTDTYNRVNKVYACAPQKHYRAYLESRKHPKIIHFAGGIKPWNDLTSDLASSFWKYARRTPYYEWLVMSPTRQILEKSYEYTLIEQGERPWKRKVADVLTPYGSQRREWLKKYIGDK